MADTVTRAGGNDAGGARFWRKRRWRPRLRTTAGRLQALGAALLPVGGSLLGVWHAGWTAVPGLSMMIVGVLLLVLTAFMPADLPERDLIEPRYGVLDIGPLTLSATLKAPAGIDQPTAYPTGSAGAHFVFPLYNPNRIDFVVSAIDAEVLSYEPIEIERLVHGVGATDVTRRFKVSVEPKPGRYRATYEIKHEYVKILAEDNDVLDVEITTATEGLFTLFVHVVGTLAGKRFDVCIPDSKPQSIVFFDKQSNYLIDRGYEWVLPYPEYIREMSHAQASKGHLREYSALDDTNRHPG